MLQRQSIAYLSKLVILLTFSTMLFGQSESRVYQSFAMRLGYEFGGLISFTVKAGAGFYQRDILEDNSEEKLPMKTFQSFSLGYRWRFGRMNPNYAFADVQAGNFLGGAGLGVAAFRKMKNPIQVVPRASVFGGLFTPWFTYDWVFHPEIRNDVGMQIILASDQKKG